MLAVAYEKTQELARDLRAVGCGDLDVEGNAFTLNIAGSICDWVYSCSELISKRNNDLEPRCEYLNGA